MSRVLTHQMEHESPTATFVTDFQRRTKLKSVNIFFGSFICITNKNLFCKQGIHAILGQSEKWGTWQPSEEQAETMLRMKSGGNLVMTFLGIFDMYLMVL